MERCIEECIHLGDLMQIQQKIIVNHLDEHKWCNHIADKNFAMIDFIKKYGIKGYNTIVYV